MELENRSSNIAKAGLTTGIIGTSLGALNWLGNGLLNNTPSNPNCNPCSNTPCCCSDDHCVDRYTLDLQMKNAKLETEKSLLESNIYTDKKSLELFSFINGEIKSLKEAVGNQAVLNQKTADSFQMVSERMANMGREFDGKIRQECHDRKCADNTIVTYANATFVPIQIAEYAVGTETRVQPTYNPLPAENCCC